MSAAKMAFFFSLVLLFAREIWMLSVCGAAMHFTSMAYTMQQALTKKRIQLFWQYHHQFKYGLNGKRRGITIAGIHGEHRHCAIVMNMIATKEAKVGARKT